MDTTVVQMRHAMKDVLSAVERNEPVNILYHGKKKAVIINPDLLKEDIRRDVSNHPFFGMKQDDVESVDDVIERLRGGRLSDI